ncbi:MAG: DUF4142 domain-containing protein [Bryobacteraceae bacterium]
MKIHRSLLACFACGALLCTPVFAARRHGHSHPSHSFTAQDFLDTAAQEQMLQAHLATMVTKHSADVGVRHFGTQISDQTTNDYRKLAMIASKLNMTLPKGIDKEGNGTISKLGKLYRGGFDRAFVDEEAASIQREVGAFQSASQSAQNPALKQYAATELPKLKLSYQETKDFAHYHLKAK